MTIEFDDKGKYFTEVISKTPVSVTIQTVTHRICGNIHIRQDQRIKDELNLPEKFLAVTDAIIYSSDEKVLYQGKFIAVQRDQIVWVMPDNEISTTSGGDVE